MFNMLEFWFIHFYITHSGRSDLFWTYWHSTKPSVVVHCMDILQHGPEKAALFFWHMYKVWHTYLLYWCHNPAAVWTPDCSDFEVLKQHWSGAECYYKSPWSRGGVWVRATLIGKRRVTQLQCLLLPLPSFTEWGYCECVPLVWSGFITLIGVFVSCM